MRFISLSSQPLDFYEARLLKASADRHNIPMEVTVVNPFDWTGRNIMRDLDAVLAAMEEDEIVLVTDLWDTFFCGGATEIEAKFIAAQTPILFSCEVVPGPPGQYIDYPASPTRWRYVNGGGWIARAGAFLAMIRSPDFWPGWAHWNQMAYGDWFCRHRESVKVDSSCQIFQTLFYTPWEVLECRDGRVVNLETGSMPCLIHGEARQYEFLYRLWNGVNLSIGIESEPIPQIDYRPRSARLRDARQRRLRR